MTETTSRLISRATAEDFLFAEAALSAGPTRTLVIIRWVLERGFSAWAFLLNSLVTRAWSRSQSSAMKNWVDSGIASAGASVVGIWYRPPGSMVPPITNCRVATRITKALRHTRREPPFFLFHNTTAK